MRCMWETKKPLGDFLTAVVKRSCSLCSAFRSAQSKCPKVSPKPRIAEPRSEHWNKVLVWVGIVQTTWTLNSKLQARMLKPENSLIVGPQIAASRESLVYCFGNPTRKLHSSSARTSFFQMRMVPSHVETLPCGNLARLSSKVGGATAAYSNLFWVVQICSSATKSLWGTPSGQLQHATRSSQEWLWAHCWLSFFLLCYQLPLLAKMSTDTSTDYVHEGRLINPPSPRGRIADHWSMGSWTLALHLQIPWYSLDVCCTRSRSS